MANTHNAPVLVIGLGRFGASTAAQLHAQNQEVLAVEKDPELVQKWSGLLSAELSPAGIYTLSALMFIGRIGTITAATALALRSRRRLYKFPEERPIIG